MSQRQVKLNPQQQFTQQAVGSVQQATQSGLNTISRMQKAAALKKTAITKSYSYRYANFRCFNGQVF